MMLSWGIGLLVILDYLFLESSIKGLIGTVLALLLMAGYGYLFDITKQILKTDLQSKPVDQTS